MPLQLQGHSKKENDVHLDDLIALGVDMAKLEARFWAKVRKSEDANGCWEWTGSKTSGGYGRVYLSNKCAPSNWQAHRLSWLLKNAQIGDTLCLDHLCRNRICVNASHLEQVTLKENIMRGISFSALNAKKDYCENGHKFDEWNTYIPKGRTNRMCKKCRKAHYINKRDKARQKSVRSNNLCNNRHEFTSENTYANGAHRTCKICATARNKARWQKIKQQQQQQQKLQLDIQPPVRKEKCNGLPN